MGDRGLDHYVGTTGGGHRTGVISFPAMDMPLNGGYATALLAKKMMTAHYGTAPKYSYWVGAPRARRILWRRCGPGRVWMLPVTIFGRLRGLRRLRRELQWLLRSIFVCAAERSPNALVLRFWQVM